MTESREPKMITRTAENGRLDELPGVGEHKPRWHDVECPSCGDGCHGGHPDILTCDHCEEDWPCPPVQAVIDEVESLADGLCCGGVLWRRAEQLRGVA